MNVMIVSGSNRQDSNSGKLSQVIMELAIAQNLGTLDLVDLENVELPIWDHTAWQADGRCAQAFAPYAERIRQAEAYIFVVPEWNGAKPAVLANFCQYCSSSIMGHKPVLIVAVSTGVSGGYAIADMRSTFYKNTAVVYTPNHVIVRFVDTFLTQWRNEQPADENVAVVRERLEQALYSLELYARHLKPVREILSAQLQKYPFGM